MPERFQYVKEKLTPVACRNPVIFMRQGGHGDNEHFMSTAHDKCFVQCSVFYVSQISGKMVANHTKMLQVHNRWPI